MIQYRKATACDLETIWNRSIRDNPDDARYLRWKQQFISRNESGEAATFVVVDGNDPVGEVTLEFTQSGSRACLADGSSCGYLCALRIRPEYEGNGHISRLMTCTEDYARSCGLTRLSIGVEAGEARNLAIYLHWGYDQLAMWEVEDETLILFYTKNLTP